jgi:hypothetical protein
MSEGHGAVMPDGVFLSRKGRLLSLRPIDKARKDMILQTRQRKTKRDGSAKGKPPGWRQRGAVTQRFHQRQLSVIIVRWKEDREF